MRHPVTVIPFDTAEEAIALGNQTEYGLGVAVWTRDISTALRVVQDIHTGVMWVNCYGLIDPIVGFGGTKLSGYGAKGSRAHLDTYFIPSACTSIPKAGSSACALGRAYSLIADLRCTIRVR